MIHNEGSPKRNFYIAKCLHKKIRFVKNLMILMKVLEKQKHTTLRKSKWKEISKWSEINEIEMEKYK